MPLRYSIVIPCYRSAAFLPELVGRLVAVMRQLEGAFEVLLVHDASGPETWQAIEALAREHPEVRGIDLMFNTGQYRATLCGLERAAGELVITMDDDLQHRPEDIPLLLDVMQQDPELDCVMGRFANKQHSLFRRLASRLTHKCYERLYGKPRSLSPSSFRLMKRELVEAICRNSTFNPAPGPLIYRSTRRIANADVTHCPRPGGGTSHRLRTLAGIVMNNVFTTSTLPLRCVSVMGLASAAGAFLLGGYYFITYLVRGYGVPGFATLVLLNLFFGGMMLFSIGLLGEYTLRISVEVQGRPRYAIRRETGDE